MDKVKLAIIYYSMGGTNYQLAKWAEEGAKEVGAEVRVLKVPELAPQSIIDEESCLESPCRGDKICARSNSR